MTFSSECIIPITDIKILFSYFLVGFPIEHAERHKATKDKNAFHFLVIIKPFP